MGSLAPRQAAAGRSQTQPVGDALLVVAPISVDDAGPRRLRVRPCPIGTRGAAEATGQAIPHSWMSACGWPMLLNSERVAVMVHVTWGAYEQWALCSSIDALGGQTLRT